MLSIAKWRINLGVTGFLPPPGGAHAANNITSWISLQNNFSLS